MRRIILGILCLCLALCLVGCSEAASSAAQAGSQPAGSSSAASQSVSAAASSQPVPEETASLPPEAQNAAVKTPATGDYFPIVPVLCGTALVLFGVAGMLMLKRI